MQRYTIFFIIVNALRVSGGFSAHHQELKLYNVASCWLYLKNRLTMHGPMKVKSVYTYVELFHQPENYALKLVDEIILYYDARLKKHQIIRMYKLILVLVFPKPVNICRNM